MLCADILAFQNWMMKKMTRHYQDLIAFKTFEERFDYLKLDGSAGVATFGFDRYLNQYFYTSYKWRQARRDVIVRDNACDLAIPERAIFGAIRVHHMNPITVEDLEFQKDIAIDPEFLICVSLNTHNAIHFGNKKNLFDLPKERKRGDTDLWTKTF
jgi:hypothetical protein